MFLTIHWQVFRPVNNVNNWTAKNVTIIKGLVNGVWMVSVLILKQTNELFPW